MNAKERIELQKKSEQKFGTEFKKIRWNKICVETKDSPNKPKSLITGIVDSIYPTGDIAFKEIVKIELWYPEDGKIQKVKIPSIYKEMKKIVIRREIVATVIYLEEKEEEPIKQPESQTS